MITHLELDIMECEVKWALGSITTNKAGRGDGIPVKLFHQVSMRMARGSVSLLSSHGRGIRPQDALKTDS